VEPTKEEEELCKYRNKISITTKTARTSPLVLIMLYVVFSKRYRVNQNIAV